MSATVIRTLPKPYSQVFILALFLGMQSISVYAQTDNPCAGFSEWLGSATGNKAGGEATQEQREERRQRIERECKEQQEQQQKEPELLLAEAVKKKDYGKIIEICGSSIFGLSYASPQRCEEDVKKAEGEIKKLPLSKIKTQLLADIYFDPSVNDLEYIQKPKMTKGYVKIYGFEVHKIVNGNLAFGKGYEFYYIKFSKSNPLRAGMYGISGYGKPCPDVNGRACVELLWREVEDEE